MSSLPLAQDKQLVQKLQEVVKALRRHDLQELQALLLKDDRPDLNYLVVVDVPEVGEKKVYSPLLFACGLNSPELVGALVNAGAKVNITVRGYSPLSHAITDGNLALVEKLLQCGARPIGKDTWNGKSDLSRAMELKHDTPADRRTRQDIVALLCEAGVDVNDPRYAKPPVLHAAASENDLTICETLVDSGADKTALDSMKNGNTPLHIAISREKPLVELVELLCHQDTLNVFNKAGFTPLHLAAEKGDLKVVRVLVREGADVNVQAPVTKLTPLDIARHKHRHNEQQLTKHQTVADFQGVVDFLGSRMEQVDKQLHVQPTHGLVRGKIATRAPDGEKFRPKRRRTGQRQPQRSFKKNL
ncbi:hypothetical protein Bbelb_387570 [Branchiostoma belcheri]|nr:hypothetical protein Bbelb_387570 [Branchiostoma belcheri]